MSGIAAFFWCCVSVGSFNPQSRAPVDEGKLLAFACWGGAGSPEVRDRHWSPDGRWLAYTIDQRRVTERDWIRISLCTIRSDGKAGKRLFVGGDLSGKEAEFAKWSPDGRRVLYWVNVQGAVSVNADGNPLWDADVRTGKRRLLTPEIGKGRDREYGCMLQNPDYVAFSPSGRQLVLARGASRFDAEAKRLRLLDYRTLAGEWLTPKGEACVDPAWSPDGRKVAYASTKEGTDTEGDGWIARLNGFRIWVVTLDGCKRLRLTTDPAYVDRGPEWTSDGSRLHFARESVRTEKTSLWEIGANGKGLRKIKDLP